MLRMDWAMPVRGVAVWFFIPASIKVSILPSTQFPFRASRVRLVYDACSVSSAVMCQSGIDRAYFEEDKSLISARLLGAWAQILNELRGLGAVGL